MHVLERVRRPEYTGENRCWPCTLVNVALVAVVAAVLTLAAPLAGIVVAVLGLTAVATRGYVVPYTPTFAPKLVAAIPGGEQLFGHADARQAAPADGDVGGLGDEDADGERVLQTLVDAGVLVGGDELHLADDFREEWRARMNELDLDALPDACVDAAPGVGHASHQEIDGQEWVVVSADDADDASETWLSLPVAIADVATIRVLTDRGVARDTAADAAAALRLFVDECPHCGGDVTRAAGDGCCGGYRPSAPDAILICTECDQRVATID